MNITHEILHVLSKETERLCLDDLTGSLRPPENSANNWRTKVTHSIRALVELDFISSVRGTVTTYYQIVPRGRQWLKDKASWDKMAADAALLAVKEHFAQSK